MQVARYWRTKKQSYRLQGVKTANNQYQMVARQSEVKNENVEEDTKVIEEKTVNVA